MRFELFFSSILQIWYVEVRISRSISVSPLEFDITRVDCNCLSVHFQAQTDGYIAIVLPKLKDYEAEMKKLLSKEIYLENIKNRWSGANIRYFCNK